MAHETLKTLITQNIKTNGQNAITAQILQDVLIAMVDDYPDLSGYATRTWVQQQDYAPKEWVQQQGYAKESALSDYLPLDGGTLTGAVNFTNTYGNGSIFVDSIDYDLNITASNMIYLDAVRGVGVNGNVTATSFIKSGGTSAQFLKADGSVDSNTYITASALTDYATKLWVTNQLGDYLPLDGGTLTGAVNFTNTYGNGSIFVDSVDHDLNITASNMIYLDAVRGVGVNGKITADTFEKSGGTAAQFLKADGSVDDNAYLPIVNGTISVSSGDMDIYSAGQQGGFATVFEAKESQDVVFMGSPSYLFDGDVHASSFIKTNGTSDEVLCADGSVKTLSELKAALNAI